MGIGATVLVAVAAPLVSIASLPPIDNEAVDEIRQPVSPLVRRAQEALSRLGLYLGVEDGRLNRATRAAIEIYQRSAGLDIDPRVSPDLVGKLEYAVGVRQLMRRLEDARANSISEARAKLLAHPATRDLVDTGQNHDVADPTRDTAACFETPTVLCLLHEAGESAKAISRAELRDWALGEILIAEARAGLGDRAMQTAAKIDDPRLVMVALRDIAEAQAATGYPEEAVAAAEIIPDAVKRADAIAAIADIQLRRGDLTVAQSTAITLLNSLDGVEDDLKRLAFRTRAAVLFSKVGAGDDAENQLTIAEATARALPRDSSRSAGLRHVASALADMQETDRALDMLQGVSNPSDRTPVLMSAAEAQAQAGDAVAALTTASSIDSIRYRSILLGRIALAQARAGLIAEADGTLDVAMAAIDRIERPYARSFAISRIALAMAEIHDVPVTDGTALERHRDAMRRAVDAAERIDDRRLRAHTLWLIAARQRAGDDPSWSTTEDLARIATESIVGDLSRVWMFASLAEGHAIGGASTAAWRAFENGMGIAVNIDNAWSRSRVMAKLAATLVRLVDPGRGQTINPE